MEARLQKLLASAGVGSRRSCEALITAGRVRVNGSVVSELGAKADPETDVIEVDRKRVSLEVGKVYLVLNKPTGYVTTVQDPHAKHTVMDLVQGLEQRVYPVGRLDADSAGLLILSNDGDFTERMTHPRHQVPKTYRAVVRGEVPEWAAADLRKGIMLEDGMTAPAHVDWIDFDEANNASIIDITIHEGRNRQVRRMFEAVGYPVLALTRMQIGPVQLKGIAPGTWRKLHSSEVKALLDAADSTPIALPQVPTEEALAPEAPEPRIRKDQPDDKRALAERKPGAPVKPRTPIDRDDAAIRAAAKDLQAKLRSAGKDDEDHPAKPARPASRPARKR